MANGTLPKLTLFISYVHEDGGISDAVNNALQNAFGEKIAVFIDKVSIQQGENIRQAIEVHLAKVDILIVVSTGTERPSHDWAGFELGFFTATHMEANAERPLWGKVVTLCSPGNQPRPSPLEKFIPMDVETTSLDKTQKEYEDELRISDSDPLLLWFGELLKALDGVDLADKAEIRDRYRRIIGDMKKRIFAEFKRRPKRILRPQRQVTVRYTGGAGKRAGQTIPDEASMTFNGGAAAIFGIQENMDDQPVSWRRFRDLVAPHHLAKFWTATLDRVMASANNLGAVEVDRGLIASHNQALLFRLVLTTCTTYFNGVIEASIYFIDVYRRKDFGNPATSLLLKGLQIVCRFRFLFLEPQSDFHYLDIEFKHDQTLSVTADRIVSELDVLTSDSIEAYLDRPAAWREFLDERQIIEMAKAWAPLKAELTEACTAALTIVDDDAEKLQRVRLANTLKKINDEMRPHNDTILKAMADKLTEYASLNGKPISKSGDSPGDVAAIA